MFFSRRYEKFGCHLKEIFVPSPEQFDFRRKKSVLQTLTKLNF